MALPHTGTVSATSEPPDFVHFWAVNVPAALKTSFHASFVGSYGRFTPPEVDARWMSESEVRKLLKFTAVLTTVLRGGFVEGVYVVARLPLPSSLICRLGLPVMLPSA